MAGLPSDPQKQALNLLNQWKAVRLVTSIASVSTRALEEQGWIERLPTLIGKAFILTPEGRHVIGESRRTVSDTVAANALYRQDARPYLQRAGYHTLRPGKGKFCVVSTGAGIPCPLLGRVTGGQIVL